MTDDVAKAGVGKKVFGFVTMTFDYCHQGHFELLRGCKMRCDHLIVGLTTDERVRVEKRQPILSYEQRFAILSNCKWVDEVVPNHGIPKAEAFEKLRFDILFSGDDYFESDEFKTFSATCPNVDVVFFPRHLTRSSTILIDTMMENFYGSQQIVSPSIYGCILRQGFGKPMHVTKWVPYSRLELRSDFASNDVFGFYKHFDQLPRNWKSPSQTQHVPFPMIAGIHANREVMINIHFKNEPWCTYLSHSTIYQSTDVTFQDLQERKEEDMTIMDFAHSVARERAQPRKIVQLVQKDAGVTFDEWSRDVCKSQEEFDAVVAYVDNTIIKTLESVGVVHSDIHPRNIMIDVKTGQVSLIDFGWVTGLLFELCDKERGATERMLASHFDAKHFHSSLLASPNTKHWRQTRIVV